MKTVVNIVLIEDDPVDAEIVYRLLVKQTPDHADEIFEIKTASTLGEGKALLALESADLILLDLGLPDCVCEQSVQSLATEFPDKPIVVLTGNDDREMASQAMGMGAQDYLLKYQIDREMLVRSIRYALERNRTLQENRENADALYRSEKALSHQVVLQEELLKVSNAILGMGPPVDIEPVLRMCKDSLNRVGLDVQVVAMKRLLDENAAVFAFYEVQPNGDFHQMVASNRNMLSILKKKETLYRANLEADLGGLQKEDLKMMEDRYGLPIRSIVNVPFYNGVMSVLCQRAHPFDQADLAVIERFAQIMAMGVVRLRDYEYMSAVVRFIPEGFCLLNAHKQVVFANTLGTQYASLIQERAGKMYIGDLSIDDLIAHSGQVHDLLIPGQPKEIIELAVGAVREDIGVGSCVILFRDVTKERASAEQVAHQERLASIGQLATGIAHDFNNMLTVMTGFAQILEMREDLDEETRADLSEIYQQGQRGAQMIRQILDFSRATDVERQPVDLTPFLKEVCKLLGRMLPENITFECEIAPEMAYVSANITQIQQVITNLVINARDAMTAGGILRVETEFLTIGERDRVPVVGMKPGNWLVLRVSDTGCGMSEDVKRHVFEPFFTTKKVGEGTGLGLSQAYGIVSNHGGFIEVMSEKGVGTTFLTYLPLVSDYDEEDIESPVLPDVAGLLVLVVEDEQTVLKSIENMLGHLGCRVLTAQNGQEALDKFQAHQFEIDAVMTDLVLPGMNGMDILETIRSAGHAPPAIIMTGYSHEAERLKDQIRDCALLLEKPIDLLSVAYALHDVLHPV